MVEESIKIKTTKKNDSQIGLSSILESTKEEYRYLQEAKNSLHTRTGILIALLTTLVSVSFIKEPIGFSELFNTNLVLAHFKLISLIMLFFAFLLALINYIRVFFTRDFLLFSYEQFTTPNETEITKLDSDTIIVAIYKDYAKCIKHNETQFQK